MQKKPRPDSHGRPAPLTDSDCPRLPGEVQDGCRAILDDLPLWTCRFLPGGELTYVNRAFCLHFGKSHVDLTGLSFFTLMPEKERAVAADWIATLNHESPTGIREHEVTAPNGEIRWQRWTNRAFFNDEGEAIIYQAIGEDITEWKRGENDRLQSEKLYRAIFKHAPFGIVITDDTGRYLDINQSMCRMLGYTRDELVGIGESKIAIQWEHKASSPLLKQQNREMDDDFRIWRFRRKDGSYLDAEMCKTDLPTNHILGIIRDLTEQKRYRDKLQQQDRLLREIGRIAKIGGWEFDPLTGTGGWTEEVARIHDVDSTKEIKVEDTLNFYPGESRNRIETAVKKAIENQQSYDLELEFISAKNIHKWVRAIGEPVVQKGRVVKVQGTFQDITERKRYEEKLQESQRRLNTLMGNLPGMAYRCKNDMEWTMEYVSKGCHDLTGYTAEELVESAKIAYADIIHHKDRQMVKDAVKKSLETSERFQLTYRIVTPTGDQKWVWESGQGILDEKGTVVSLEGFINDISNLKTTENALRKSEKLSQETQALARVGGWEMDMATSKVTWTDELYRIFGVSPETHEPGDVSRDMSFFAPESIPIIKKAFDRAMKRGEPYDLELAFFPASGERLWVRTLGKPVMKNGKVVRIAGNVMDITKHKESEKALAESEKRFRQLVENAPDAIVVQTQGKFAYLNNAAVRLIGAASADELIGTPVIDHVHPNYRDISMARIRRLNQEKMSVASLHIKFLRQDGSAVDAESSAIPFRYDEEDGALVFIRDISARVKTENEQKVLQEQLNQAQKMESVGRLAGGVAHDYNNILSVIIGYTELSMDEAKPNSPLHQNLKEVLKAAHRSREVTRQLLAFARKEAIEPEVLDLNASVNGMLKMISRLIGEDIELTWQPSDNLWPIEIDPSQIDQIMANLCVNARDSIANVGQISITTGNVRIDEKHCAKFTYFSPGDYVTLTVKDDGCGMDRQIVSKIFEPFFTTKGVGKGTGLGLSTVYGIVKQNKGFINVESEPGRGTVFTVFFPRSAGKTKAKRAAIEIDTPKGKGETILVVEDEVSMLELIKTILDKLGYRVLTAGNPSEALRVVDSEENRISVLITDVVMPEMNGRELADQLRSILPGIGCLFISGYTADVIAHSGVLESGLTFLQKPFSVEDLAIKVRKVIDSECTEG